MSRSKHLQSLARAFALAACFAPAAAGAQQAMPEATPPPPTPPPVPQLTTSLTRQANLEGRILWMDATANVQRLSTREGVSAIFDKCKRANINTVVVDVKPLSGQVLYDSKVAPRLTEWKGFHYPEGYDLLFTAMLEGHRRGIKVYASMNTFCEGHKLTKQGPLYQDPKAQATVYDVERTVHTPDGTAFTLAVGQNRVPGDGQVASYDSSFPDGVGLGPDEAAVLVTSDGVSALIDGAVAEGGRLRAPQDGYVLVGKGAGARWLMEHVQVGQALTFSTRTVLQPILDSPSETVGAFVNPVDPQARAHALAVVDELANNYAVDGIVFDRMRYSSLRTDFSPLSRELFEKFLGKAVERFPEDIYSYDPVPGRPIIAGPYYKEWLEWRAKNISDWLEEARQTVNRRRPGTELAVYVGSWYPTYFGVGVNWGAQDSALRYDWMSPSYGSTGYASKLNWLTTGCYYRVATREDARQLGAAEEFTVEAAAETSLRAVNDNAFVYAGIQLLDYKDRPEDFRRALQAAVRHSQGVMLFDLVYLEDYNWWSILEQEFSVPRRAPHDVPGLQEAIQQTRKALQPVAAAAN